MHPCPLSLCRVLDGCQVGEMSASQKTVFMFLHHLFTNCSYLQTTYRAFGRSLYMMGEKVGVAKESHPPTVRTDLERQRPDAIANISKPRYLILLIFVVLSIDSAMLSLSLLLSVCVTFPS